MAKLGRYSAQRKKVLDLGTTPTTISVAQCGTEFLVNQAGSSNITHTLPAAAAAGEGWWCAFTLKTAVGNAGADVTIASPANNIKGVELGDAATAIAHTNIVIEGNAALQGTRVEMWTDGTNYYAITMAVADADIAPT